MSNRHAHLQNNNNTTATLTSLLAILEQLLIKRHALWVHLVQKWKYNLAKCAFLLCLYMYIPIYIYKNIYSINIYPYICVYKHMCTYMYRHTQSNGEDVRTGLGAASDTNLCSCRLHVDNILLISMELLAQIWFFFFYCILDTDSQVSDCEVAPSSEWNIKAAT